MKTEKKDDAMDELMKKFKEMEVKLLGQSGNNNDRRNYQRNYQGNYQGNNNERRNYRNNDDIRCYNCNRTGHIRPKCPELGYNGNERNFRNDNNNSRNNGNERNFRNNNNPRNNERNYNRNDRSLNFISTSNEDRNVQYFGSSDEDEDDYQDDYQEYNLCPIQIYESEDDDEEYQIYPAQRTTRSKSKPYERPQVESRKEQKLRFNQDKDIEIDNEDSDVEMQDNRKGRMSRNEALQKAHRARERKFRCRNCDTIGHFTANCPTLPSKEKERIMRAREKSKERKQKVFPVNLEERIRNAPCGLSIEEAMKMMPGYKKNFSRVFKVVKKGERVNYMGTPEKSRFTSMRSKAEIEDVEIDAIIDTGAAISAITRSLMEELGYKIDQSSNVVINTADGTRSRSLGKILDMELTLNGINTSIDVQVIESKDRTLILGNDWLQKVKARIDMDKGKLSIKGANGLVDIPVEFFIKKEGNNEESEDEEYEEEELREARF